ncbi:JmjC domain-containing protein [Pseudomonas lini]
MDTSKNNVELNAQHHSSPPDMAQDNEYISTLDFLGATSAIELQHLFQSIKTCWAKKHYISPKLFIAEKVAKWISLEEIGYFLAQPGFLEKNTVIMRSKEIINNHRPINRQEISSRLDQGLSIQIRKLQEILPKKNPAIELSTMLEHICGHPLESVTLFISPPGEQALPRHSDEAEIFSLQLTGEKHWEINGDIYTLTPGGFAYIPATTPHEVKSSGEGISLSLAFVFKALTLKKILHTRLSELLEAVGAMATLPILKCESSLLNSHELKKILHQVTTDFSSIEKLSECAYRNALSLRTPPPLQLIRSRGNPSSLYERNFDVDQHIEVDNNNITLTLSGGAKLIAPFFIEPELRSIFTQTKPFSAETIAINLDANQCLLLIEKLQKAGILKKLDDEI